MIAVCVSGQARDNGKWLKQLVKRLPENTDYYFAFFDSILAEKTIKTHSPKRYKLLKQRPGEWWREQLLERYDATEEQKRVLYTPDKKRGGCLRDNPLRMFYAIKECNDLVEGYYEYVIRARPDIRINRPKYDLGLWVKSHEIGVPMNSWTPIPYYRSDKFFFGTQSMMKKVSNLYEDLPKVLDKTINPEHGWLSPEVTLHWAIKHLYGGETVPIKAWDIDRYRVKYAIYS